MRVILLVGLLVVAFSFASAPAHASATYGVCIEGKSPCRGGDLACVTKDGMRVACAPDPCYTTRCF